MSRSTNININVQSGQSIATIGKLKDAFVGLQKAKEQLGKDGKMKLSLDFTGIDKSELDAMAKSVSKLGAGMKDLKANAEAFKAAGGVINATTNNITNNVNKAGDTITKYGNTINKMGENAKKTTDKVKAVGDAATSTGAKLNGGAKVAKTSMSELAAATMAYSFMFNALKKSAAEYNQLTATTFNVGIASQMNLAQIDALNSSFLQLATTVPASAQEMATAVDALIRTGRSFEDSRKIIEQVAVLSAASGDSLKDTSAVVTKVMVSLGISGDRVTDTLTTMHSTAIQTASDMGYLAEAFKNVAGSVAVMAKQSGRSGKALDDYKQTLLDISMASVGSMANLGLSASQAGTKIKNLFTKLQATEKSASMLFNTSMKLSGITFDNLGLDGVNGDLFNYGALSDMAKKDLPSALNVLSQMYVKGQLNTQTMQKMFTARHFMEISNLLLDINGNTDAFVSKIAKGVDYTNDFAKKMFDINEQMKILSNNAKNGMSGAWGVSSNGMLGVIMGVNDILKEMNPMILKTVLSVVSIGGAFATAAIGAGLFMKVIAPLFAVAGAMTLGASIAATAVVLGVVGAEYVNIKKQTLDLNINLNKNLLLNKQIGAEIETRINMENLLKRTIDDSVSSRGEDLIMIEESSTIMGRLLEQHKDLKSLLEATSHFKPIDESFSLNRTEEEMVRIDKLKEDHLSVQSEEKQHNDKMLAMVGAYIKTADNLYSQQRKGQYSAHGLEGRVKDMKVIQVELDKIIDKGGSFKEFEEALSKQGVNPNALVNIFGTNWGEQSNKKLEGFILDKTKIAEQLKEVTGIVLEKNKEMNTAIEANNKAQNMLTARGNDALLRNFEAMNEYNGKAGVGGFFDLMDDAYVANLDTTISNLGKQKEELKKQIDEIRGLLALTPQGEEYKALDTDLQTKENILKELEEDSTFKEKQKKDGLKYDTTSLELQYKELEMNRENRDILFGIVKLEEDKIRIRATDPTNLSAIASIDTNINRDKYYLDWKLKNPNGKGGTKRGGKSGVKADSDYEMKYNNYIKENLSLELEIAKVMMTQGQQAMLTYKYKKEELEINKKLAHDESSFAKARLAETGFGGDITTAKGAQAALDSMYSQYGHTTKDEKLKNQFESLKVLTQALVKEEKLAVDIMLQPLKEFEEMLTSIPSLIKGAYSSLNNGSGTLSIWNVETAKAMERDVINSLEKIKNSWTTGEGANKVSLFAGMNEGNIDQHLANSTNSVQLAQSDAQVALEKRDNNISLTAHEENLIILLSTEVNKLEDIKKLKDEINEKDKTNLDIALAKLDTFNKTGAAISKLGSITGFKGLEDIGGVFSSFGDLTKMFEGGKNDFSFSNIFNPKDMTDFSDNFGKAMQSALEGLDFGSMVGSMVGGITGGGASAQAGGAVGGMIGSMGGGEALAGAMGMGTSALATGGASLAISAAMSLVGGLFGDDGKDQEEAERKSKEANKAYDKNTDALNKLASNMSSLSGGIDGLNSSLISSFSKMPTFGNLTDVTSTLQNMYSTMEKTRMFNEVAYQVTKTKKGKSGFMGIGASADTSWTETISVSVQEMLNKYGFKGRIEDMSTDQLRGFSSWLEDYDMGDSDNFSILAGAIEDYAEALDKFDKNIENFFYDTTMESFAGISSLQQEELRQQIEDFYKDLGFQIDEEMSKTIDELAESMSVMVTIMQDVRGSFVDSWRDSGKTAGNAFLSSMTPYIDAMLENISQVFYDVYFSDVTSLLEDEFKTLSEQLVELKKQGADLDWDTVAGSLSGSFDKVISAIKSAQTETESFNDIVLALQTQALEAGMTLSELLELGLVSGSQKNVFDSFKDAMLSSDSEGALDAIGQMVGDKVGNAIADKLIDNMLSDKILQFSANMDKIVNGNLSFDSLAGLANEALSVGMMLDEQRQRMEAIKSMFDFNGDINYESQESNVDYSSGTSSNIVNNYFLTASVEAGNVIESDSIDRLTDSLLDSIIEKLRVDRGIDITKNY